MGGIWLLVMSIYPSLTCVYTLVLIWKESYSGGTTEMINYWSINIGRQNTSQKSFHMHSDDDHGALGNLGWNLELGYLSNFDGFSLI